MRERDARTGSASRTALQLGRSGVALGLGRVVAVRYHNEAAYHYKLKHNRSTHGRLDPVDVRFIRFLMIMKLDFRL